MIIHNFNVFWPICSPGKANTILFINADTILPLTITFKTLKAVARWKLQLLERVYGV